MLHEIRHQVALRRFWIRQRYFDKVCFIHINKCGGTSIERTLGIPKVHDTALQRRTKIGRAAWRRMFTFALIRHPYSKAVSHYKYRVHTNQTGLGEKPLALDEWIRLAYGEKDPAYYDKPLMFAPCLDWVANPSGEILVDRVVKLEDLSSEWQDLSAQIGADGAPGHVNRTSAHSQSAARSALSASSRDILRQHFAKDFDRFGYAG